MTAAPKPWGRRRRRCARCGAILLAVALTLSGCRSTPPTMTLPNLVGGQQPWTQRLQDRAALWRCSQSLYRVSLSGPGGKASVRALVTAQLPDRIRIEAGSIWGQTYGVLTLEPGQARLWLASENKFFLAADSAAMLERLLGLPLPAEALVELLLAADGSPTGAAPPGQEQWRLRVGAAGLAGVDTTLGQRSYRISYDPPLASEAVGVPERVVLETPGWRVQAQALQSERLDTLDPDLFRLAPPPGVEIQDLQAQP